jgi:hypothetical protein
MKVSNSRCTTGGWRRFAAQVTLRRFAAQVTLRRSDAQALPLRPAGL